MARRNWWQRLKNIFRATPEPPKPSSPTTSPSRRALKQRALDNFLARIPYAKADVVDDHLDAMDIDELVWTASAGNLQLVNAARQDSDRIFDDRPLNPWWYN